MESRYREDVGNVQNSYLGHYGTRMYYSNGSYTNGTSINFNTSYHPPIRRTWDEIHPGPPFRSGGPFRSVAASDGSDQIQAYGLYSSHNLVDPPTYEWIKFYEGAFQPRLDSLGIDYTNFSQIGLSGAYGPSWKDPSEYGASAWKRFAPKLEFAQLGVFIAEFRDVPRMLRTTSRTFKNIWKSLGGKGSQISRKSVGNNFLNQEFGWKPFISDIKQMISVTRKFDRHYAQIRLDNGRWIRRSGTYQLSHTVDSYHVTNFGATDTYMYPCAYFPSDMFNGPYRGLARSRVLSDEKISFSGKFRYWIPSFSNDSSRLNQVRNMLQIYGARLSPEVLWETMPWSWLIDWWSNAGDVIHNMSIAQLYGLAAEYAFVMRQVRKSFELTVEPNFKFGPNHTLTASGYISSKRREAANPWGFDLEWGELSPTQIAILTALGLSKF